MKRYNIYDIFPKGNKSCFYKSTQGSLFKITREYIKVGTGYIKFTQYAYRQKLKQWKMQGQLNESMMIEKGKDWKRISSAEAFIEIL